MIVAISTTKTMLDKLADAIEAGDREAETELREAISAYVIYREITAEGSRLTAIYQVQDEKPSCQIVIKDDKCKTKS